MSLQHDPFDWPFPQRRDLMSLSTIKQVNGLQGTKSAQQFDPNLRIDDISGAQPCLKAYKYTNKQTFGLEKLDIFGASSRVLIKPHNRSDLQLYNQDIKGSQPQINKFITTREPSNPLEPLYRIPKAVPRISTPPKFIRDNINVDDIEGTKPMPNFQKLSKNIHVFEEIEGSRPKARFQPKDHIDMLDVRDINNYMEFKSTRITNPLEPVYNVMDDEGKKTTIGKIQGSQSRQLHPTTINKLGSTILNTHDIAGAQAGTHAEMFLRAQNGRKDFRTSNLTTDVPGAQVGSLRKGMESIRHTNPIQPSYQNPGHTEIYGGGRVFQTAGTKLARAGSQQSIPNKSNAQKLDSFIIGGK